MYSGGGGGWSHAVRKGPPPKPTGSGIQCQKCLQRGHYSYECKTPTSDRPYVPRPSRTKQLSNPKLQPKLQSTLQDSIAEKKKAVVDAELARREAERQREREREEREDKLLRDVEGAASSRRDKRDDKERGRGRKRRESFSSVETVSTRRECSRERGDQGKEKEKKEEMTRGRSSWSRSRSVDSRVDSRSRSRGRSRSHCVRRSRSPVQDRRAGYRDRSRSLVKEAKRERLVKMQEEERERSLSPYSRRVAMTMAMRQGR